MCGGPSSTQTDLQKSEADFYHTQVAAYNTAYSNFKGIQDTLNAQFAPILARGPNQMGFNAEELQTLRTQATEGTAQGYAKAQRALQQRQAAEGGGTSNVNMTSGESEQERQQLASQAEAIQSTQNLGITEAGYQQGYNEWQNAVQGEENLAAGWNPNAFSGSVNTSAQTANSEANTIAQQQNSMWQSVIGALGGIAGQAAGGWTLGMGKPKTAGSGTGVGW